jgi:transcriptional regulator with XRE-family HTH domain
MEPCEENMPSHDECVPRIRPDRGRTGGLTIPPYARAVDEDAKRVALRPVEEHEVEEPDEFDPEELRAWGPPRPERPDPLEGDRLIALAVGRAVKAHRRSLRLSQADYGRRSGLDQAAVSRLERGLRPLSVQDLVRIAADTGRSVRIHVFPDDGALSADERVDITSLGSAGSVRVAIGRAPRMPPAAPLWSAP